jgi:4-diphosphocytidyl-2-C-methyl-D-erythritol kinase
VTLLPARVSAHAKINLFLRVLEREADGYHRIETVFQRLALADDVTLAATTGERRLDVSWDGMPGVDIGPPDQNLAWRAAEAFRDAAGWPDGWRITMVKRIPAGAGLGGGSSDAAAVLRALNGIAPSPLAPDRLIAIGAGLGADVAFFVSGLSLATGEGRGHMLAPLSALPRAHVVLAIPLYGIGTGGAYAALADMRGPDARAGDGGKQLG